MTKWEKTIQKYYEQLGYRTEWVHLTRGAVFILAWKGKEVQVVFVDLKKTLLGTSAADVREEFLALISHLIKESDWERIFKGRNVLFKWLTPETPSEDEKKTLALAGVEPFLFMGQADSSGKESE